METIFRKVMEGEVWKDIIGYEGKYQVSNFGKVKSLKTNKIKNGYPNNKGYLLVSLSKSNKYNSFTIHSLVAVAFLGHKPDGTCKIVVDHIDNNKLNNNVNNLQLISQRENASKDKINGTSKYVGVSWNNNHKKWFCSIFFKGVLIYLGLFDFEKDASHAYQKALKEIEQGLDLNILYCKGRNKTSKFKYVSWNKMANKWAARYKGKHLGYYDNESDANNSIIKYSNTFTL